MIAKQKKGKSFRGLLNYLHEKEGNRLIAGNMGGKTPRTLSAEFAVSRQLNPRLEKAVYHSSLSLPETDNLDDDNWSAFCEDYIEGMGFGDSQYVVYRHNDRDHDHVHIVASRIKITDGTTVSDSWDYVRSENLIRELENKYELTPTISSNQKQRRGQTSGEIRLIERTGEESVRNKLQEIIDSETGVPKSMPELVNCLKDRGVNARVNFTRTGKIRGISYQLDEVSTSGTHLGKAYTFPGLQKHRQITYNDSLQREELAQASDRSPVIETSEEREREKNKQIEIVHQQQIERSLIIAPILIDYINYVGEPDLETEEYKISWQKSERTLLMYRKEDDSLLLASKYQGGKFELLPIPLGEENKPLIQESDIQYWQRIRAELIQQLEEKKKKDKEQEQKKQSRRRRR